MALSGTEPVTRIGLTGGIGSGKSTVATRLVALGAVLVDTDAIAHALTAAGGAAMPAIEAAFGPGFVTREGALDRAAMRAAAFADESQRLRLQALLHPLIGAEAQRRAADAGSAPVVFDVPLLAESAHWRARVQRVLVVDCSEATQVARVARRPGWTAEAALAVIGKQAGRAARRAIADAVLHNDGIALDELARKVDALWRRWQGQAAAAA